ncbi:hypothetical protein [Nodosilinea sp. FACHB-13]|uniref:hypothetical protein n=1 Tax=Cyanophyceae TaxID=3028117 RepID=UPI00168333FA|nr:hypothetical protein [Nodosilinea sp. FACHB-13]MBD2107579.1 hypothetical protein [Nodosilinea sp. FACHB-13]
MPAATSNVLGQNNKRPVSKRKLAQLFSMLRLLIVNCSPAIAKLAQLFSDLRPLIVNCSPVIVKLAQLFGNFTPQFSFVQATAIPLPCVC